MSEYLFAHLIDKRPVGEVTGQSIPHHLTLLHWFGFDRDPSEIIEAASSALSNIGQLTTRATAEDMFGPKHDVPVMRLERTPELVDLHKTLLETTLGLGAILDSTWTGTNKWNPHVTHKDDQRLHPGEHVNITDIDLISRENQNAQRKILYRFNLAV